MAKSSPAAWIAAYFVFNMGLTLYNKTVLLHFPYPFTLTALHTFCGTIGCIWARRVGYYTPASLTRRQEFTLLLFSVLYTFNIAISNISLQLVSVPFHQVVRASSPIFTITVAWLLRNKRDGSAGLLGVGTKKLMSLVPVIAGVGFATYGDYSFTAWGLILTLFGTFLAALKTVLTSILQTAPASSRISSLPTTSSPTQLTFAPETPGTTLSFLEAKAKAEKERGRERKSFNVPSNPHSTPSFVSRVFPPSPSRTPPPRSAGWSFLTKRFDLDFQSSSPSAQNGVFGQSMSMIKLHPLDLLARMSPLACAQCVVYALLSGETGRLQNKGLGDYRRMGLGLTMNGLIAFMLNVVSLTANQKNGPLTMTVAANVKQVLTILLAMSVFNVNISGMNALGVGLTLLGGAWYGVLEYRDKRRRLMGEVATGSGR